MQKADLHLGGSRALSASKRMECAFWQNLGRCVAVNQMPDIRAKADVVIWCVTPQSIVPGVSVEIVGWNTVAEIARLPPVCTGLVVGNRQVHNHQVPIEQVRPFADLVNLIMEPGLQLREKHHPNEQASHKEAKAGFEPAKSRDRQDIQNNP